MAAHVFAAADVVTLRSGSDAFELTFGHLDGDADHALLVPGEHVQAVVDGAGDAVVGVLVLHTFHVVPDLFLGHAEPGQQLPVAFAESLIVRSFRGSVGRSP